jgi:hypothetical protein
MSITHEEIVRYVDGEIDDEKRLREIERAIEENPEVAGWYAQATDDTSSSPTSLDAIGQRFTAVERSIWAPIHWNEVAETDGERIGVVRLPGREPTRLCVYEGDDGLEISFEPPVDGLRPASLAAVTPNVRRLVLGKPVEEVRPGSRERADTAEGHGGRAAEAPLFLAAKSVENVRVWRGPKRYYLEDDGRGTRGWLQTTSFPWPDLFCEVLTRRPMLAKAYFHLKWTDEEGEHEVDGVFDLEEAPIADLIERLKEPDAATVLDSEVVAKQEYAADSEYALFLTQLKDVSTEPAVREIAADALGQIRDAASRDALIRTLHEDPSEDIRLACAEALGKIGDRESRTVLLEIVRDDRVEEIIRATSEEAIAKAAFLLTAQHPVDGVQLDILRDAGTIWSLELRIGDFQDVDQLTTTELRDYSVDAATIIPLTPKPRTETTESARFEARPRSAQLAAWNDPKTRRLVQFEPSS